jgi:hypothetical protein
MKKTIFAALLFAVVCCAQTTITVTVTIPALAAPVATNWVASLCASLANNGSCATQQYPDVATAVKALIAQALNAQALTAALWAVNNQDASLPSAVLGAITSAQAAGLSIDPNKTAAAMVAANPIMVQ